tara:strand:- start:242 stop:1366 length:1125 start_codon:yes stop_codon:yes gene_type:complete
MSLLSFVGGIAQGMSEDIDRKRALADKKDLAAEQLENQIKAMTEQTAINDRQYEARKKLEKAERIAKNMSTYTAMNIPIEAAKAFATSDSDDLKTMIFNRAQNFPDTDWNALIEISENTGEEIDGIIQPSFRFKSGALFETKRKTYDTIKEHFEAARVSLAQAEIDGNVTEINKFKERVKGFAKYLIPKTDDDPFAKEKLSSLASSRMGIILGEKYAKESASGNIQTIIRGDYFQFAEKYDTFIKDFEAVTKDKADLAQVQNYYDTHKSTQQTNINNAIESIEAGGTGVKNKIVTLDIPSSVHKNGGEAIAKYIKDNITSKPIKLNDVLQYNLMLPPEQQTPDEKSMGAKKGLWGGSFQKSFTDTGFKFQYVVM